MDIPDKIFTEENTRLWRTETIIHYFDPSLGPDYRWQNPVPVYSDRRVVGFATLEARGPYIHAYLTMDYGIPERLEAETGTRVWALPFAIITDFIRAKNEDGADVDIPTSTYIDSLQLRTDCTDPALPSLGEPAL